MVVGVSIGSLNAAVLSTFEKGDEKNAVEYLRNLWRDGKSEDMWQNWPYVSIASGFWKNSLLDSSPMHKTVQRWLGNKTLHRKVAF